MGIIFKLVVVWYIKCVWFLCVYIDVFLRYFCKKWWKCWYFLCEICLICCKGGWFVGMLGVIIWLFRDVWEIYKWFFDYICIMIVVSIWIILGKFDG